eukprot:4540100-Karenia_brevis.AAC.1
MFHHWVRKFLGGYLKDVSCIVRSTDELLRCLADVQVTARTQFVTFDVKDLYLNGSHEDWAKSRVSMLSGAQRRALYDVLLYTLHHQYVATPTLGQR